MVTAIQHLGRRGLSWFQQLGRGLFFLLRLLSGLPSALTRGSELIRDLYNVGVLSMTIIGLSGLAVGMVLGLEIYRTLVDFGGENSLGPVVGLALVRELGPVLTALLFAGRAGSALTAEIGLMKATDQLSVMDIMAVDPMRRVVAPRFIAGFLSLPLLAIIFSAVGVLGSYFIAVGLLGVDDGAFWSQMQAKVSLPGDVLNGIIKSVAFGFVVSWIAVYEGYEASPTTEGVSRATTRTVVHSAFTVLALDFVLTALMFGD